MQKRLIQALLFLGVISIPTFASAEGGLLSNVTNEVDAVTDKATTSVHEAVSAPDEEKDKSSEEDQQANGNILSNTVDSVTGTVGETTESVTGTVNAATKTVGNTVNKTVEKTTKSVTGTVNSTTKTVTSTVEETTKPVTESLSDDKPLLEVDLSDDSEVKVNTGVVDAEVSKDPQVKVDTGVVDTDVSKVPAVKVDVETEVPHEPLVDTKDKDRDVEREREDVRKEPIKEEVSIEPEKRSIQISKAKKLSETILTKPVEVEEEDSVEMEEPINHNGQQPFPPRKKMEPVLTTTTMNSTSQSSSTSGMSGQVTGASSLWVVSEQYATAVNFQKANMYEKKNLYYDQWLNAPPSQPPQDSLLFKSI